MRLSCFSSNTFESCAGLNKLCAAQYQILKSLQLVGLNPILLPILTGWAVPGCVLLLSGNCISSFGYKKLLFETIPKMDTNSKTRLVDFGFASRNSIWIVSRRFYTKTENIFPEISPKVAPVYFTVWFIIFLIRIFSVSICWLNHELWSII